MTLDSSKPGALQSYGPSHKDVLRSVLLSLEQSWLRQGVAADQFGRPVAAYDPRAVSWTLVGAVNAAPFPDYCKHKAMGLMRSMLPKKLTLTTFNETASSVEQVLDLVRRALAR